MNKKELTESDICTKYITPAIKAAGWDIHTQIREEVTLTAGRVIVKGQMGTRAKVNVLTLNNTIFTTIKKFVEK